MKALLPLLGLLCVAPVVAKEKSPPPPKDKVVVLEPLKVAGTPIISYAVDIRIYADPGGNKVDRIFITRVWEASDAEASGVQAGDEIVKLDGKPVKEFEARVSVNSPLGQLLLNRKPGDALKLELLTHRTENVTLRAQRTTLPDSGR